MRLCRPQADRAAPDVWGERQGSGGFDQKHMLMVAWLGAGALAAMLALLWLVQRRLVYFGESLGAAVALSLAVEQPPAALVLRSPFTSLADMGRVHYPFVPAGLVLRDRFDSLGQVGRLTCPVLVIAGEQDRIVPPE